jgi:NAD(P)H-dependent FMN reductase
MRILAICGSLRKQSLNLHLLQAAAELAPPDTQIEFFPLHDLPAYNGDEDNATLLPAAVKALRAAVEASDGILLASPEFSHAYSGVLKNALDWLSDSDSLADMPATSISAAPNLGGGVRGQLALREVLFALGADVFVHYELLVRSAKQKFDADGTLSDADTREQLAKFIADFAEFIRTKRARVPV